MNVSGNNTVPSINDYDYAIRPETYIVPALFALIFVIGTIGNGTLVLIFVRHKQMRNVPNIYILNLALGDLLVIISCVPFTSTVYTVIITLCYYPTYHQTYGSQGRPFDQTFFKNQQYCLIAT